jgi:threonyl-tRNA synthetase
MLTLQFPDGSTKQVAEGTRAAEVALGIGKRLADAAIAAKVDGGIIDLDRELPPMSKPIPFQVLTNKDREALDVLRHSCAHVMARAVMRLFPGVQLAFGPTIENGFYYDIDVTPPIGEEDFPRVEAEMAKIIADAEPFERFERPTSEARALCEDLRQGYKVEHIDDELKQYPSLSFYRQGEFIDLCRGPHIPHAGKIGAFKLLSIAGAYWKNDAGRKQLQRLYGTAFFSQKDLDAYLKQLEEAKKRDHRVLGKQLKLFTISPTVGSGLILWMPKGATVRGILEGFIKDELVKRGYQPVYTPHIGRLELYRTSGHFPYYRDAQFPPMYFWPAAGGLDLAQWRLAQGELDEPEEKKVDEYFKLAGFNLPGYREANRKEKLEIVHKAARQMMETMGLDIKGYDKATTAESRAERLLGWLKDQEGYLLKPMNCPHHIQIYKAEPRSYRDLPVRLAEFGTVYRFEQTGELAGMTRVRGFTQDDAHLFCTEDQVSEEVRGCIELTQFILDALGLTSYSVRLGLRDPDSAKYVGEESSWEKAEDDIGRVARSMNLPDLRIEPGEAAFYGPKIDFMVRDCIGREWQLGTVQLDYNLPKRFELEYTGPDNRPHQPVMIHRAPFGSMERFVGILIEHFAGAFPLWLAPEQARIVPISEKHLEYARKIEQACRDGGFRVTTDARPEKMQAKIREAQLEKIPYMLVVGDKEQAADAVAIRDRVDGDLGAKPIEEVLAMLAQEVRAKRIREVSTASAGLGDENTRFGE